MSIRALEAWLSQGELANRATFFDLAFKALVYNGIRGDYAEFGCHGARTFVLAHKARTRHAHDSHMWALDSFQGLPRGDSPADEHPQWSEGAMATTLPEFERRVAAHGVERSEYTAVAGFYNQTLTDDAGLPRTIALAYIDCDLYTSTRDVLAFLGPRLHSGMILAFDDYFCMTVSGMSGEQRALEEFLAGQDAWRLVPYLTFGWHGQSFMVAPVPVH